MYFWKCESLLRTIRQKERKLSHCMKQCVFCAFQFLGFQLRALIATEIIFCFSENTISESQLMTLVWRLWNHYRISIQIIKFQSLCDNHRRFRRSIEIVFVQYFCFHPYGFLFPVMYDATLCEVIVWKHIMDENSSVNPTVLVLLVFPLFRSIP